MEWNCVSPKCNDGPTIRGKRQTRDRGGVKKEATIIGRFEGPFEALRSAWSGAALRFKTRLSPPGTSKHRSCCSISDIYQQAPQIPLVVILQTKAASCCTSPPTGATGG